MFSHHRSENQDFVFDLPFVYFLWVLQQLFDGLWIVLHEGLLLLKKVENVHLKTCESVQAAAHEISALFERFIPAVQRSKARQFHVQSL